jgi:hypothetical protein
MTEELPAVLKGLDTTANVVERFLAWRKRNVGDARALVEELKQNSRILWLVAEREIGLDKVIGDLSTKKYDQLLSDGFNFDSIRNKKIARYKYLQNTDLASWQGKKTSDLIASIYDKIKDIKTLYPHAKNSKKLRWHVRVLNIQKRISLLLRHAGS